MCYADNRLPRLRSSIKKYFDEVANSWDVIVVPRTAEGEVVFIMSIKEYNALHETAYLLSSAKNKERLTEAMKQAAQGGTVSCKPARPDKKNPAK